VVWGRSPGIWDLGGDLGFSQVDSRTAAEELRSYAYACIEAVYQNLTKMGLPIDRSVWSKATPGRRIRERVDQRRDHRRARQQRWACPEVLFNMFPGMGPTACCVAASTAYAQQMILSGRLYEAQGARGLGLVDLVVTGRWRRRGT
jgi:hypothetical protein